MLLTFRNRQNDGIGGFSVKTPYPQIDCIWLLTIKLIENSVFFVQNFNEMLLIITYVPVIGL